MAKKQTKNIDEIDPSEFILGKKIEGFEDDWTPEQLERLEQMMVAAMSRTTSETIKAQITAQMGAALTDEVVKRLPELLQAKLDALQFMPRKVEITLPSKEIIKQGIQHYKYPELCRNVSAGLNIQLVGPAGTGKSEAALMAAQANKLDFYSISCNEETSKSDIVGFIDAMGVYRPSLIRKGYEHGGLVLWDEYDAGSAPVMVASNGMTANKQYGFPDGMVQRHANNYHIFACNTFGLGADRVYVARKQLDAATLDRLVVIEWDYDYAFEMALAPNQEWCSHVQRIRKAVEKLKMRKIVSMRATFYGAKLLECGEPWEQVEKKTIWKELNENDIARIRSAMSLTEVL